MLLDKASILAADDRPSVELDVPEWGGRVRISAMSALQRDRYEMLLVDSKSNGTNVSIRAALCASCIVDEQGQSLFAADDVAALEQKSGAALGRVFDAAMKLNKIGEKAVEEEVKN